MFVTDSVRNDSVRNLRTPSGVQYSFGNYLLDADGVLLRDSAIVPIPPKELSILRLLLERAGQVVSQEQLRRRAWGKIYVSDDSLPRCISSLRARLQSSGCIETYYKRGYRFSMPVDRNFEPGLGADKPENDGDRDAGVVTQNAALPGQPDRADSADRAEGGLARHELSAPLPRLAILPLTTGPGVPESLGPELAETVMLRLSRVRRSAMEIVARDSVFHLAGQSASAREIGIALGADLVLVGHMTALASHFRVRAEMIRVADAMQLWIEDFLVPRESLADLDTLLARRITARVQRTFLSRMTPASPQASAGPVPELAETDTIGSTGPGRVAYAAQLQSAFQLGTLLRRNVREGIRGMQKAVESAPSQTEARLRRLSRQARAADSSVA
jgi:DNA-binding winged helix-turn-helix (wHTH) protein/TolB-like protein